MYQEILPKKNRYTKFGYSNWGLATILLCLIGFWLEYPNTNYTETGKWHAVAITNKDIDIVTRTVIGEAATEREIGKIAVIFVILNRSQLNLKHFGGNNLSDISLKCSSYTKAIGNICQFEPWMKRRNYLWSITENDNIYKYVKRLVIECLDGWHKDPTNGATHFLEPSIVMRRSGKLPSWAKDGIRIGNHVFYRLER